MAIVKDNVDFNSVESGIINYSYATGILNATHEGSYGILFSIKRENGQIWQMCRDFSNGYLYQRHRNADGWLPWRITYDTSLLINNGLLGELANALGELTYQSIVFEHGETITTPYATHGLFELTESKYQERQAVFFIDKKGDVTWLTQDQDYIKGIFSVTLDTYVKITNMASNNLTYAFVLKKYI